ncbi:hypothetical protein AVDCRST_MAG81-552 [uncultured Synechococcales cyanobacterium]|uniref:Uncharacterized protein n=1 Tax=uncultured Synechococcales cyanobacterium TaxID=1936017 RepID=A0A6J4UU09_9CYAN|nr:hypothetical protein AVDCRST_MAG81-552 [uncultured Synechococcales cyanobacterium]
MKETVTNLATPIVKQEVATVLETYPDHPYQKAFANPELRQCLIAYVLSEVDCKFAASQDGEQPQVSYEMLFPSQEHQTHLKNAIHQGIEQLLKEKADWVEHHIPAKSSGGQTASQWFG